MEADARAAANAIVARRTLLDAPNRDRLTDELLDIAEHVHRYRAGIPRAAAEKDIRDAWLILNYLDHQIDVHRLALLKAADLMGMTFGEVAPLVGQNDRRGAEALRRRLEAAVAGRPKVMGVARGDRREARAREALERRRAATSEACMRALLRIRHLLPDGPGEDLDDLAADTTARPAGMAASLRGIAKEILTAQPGPDIAAVAQMVLGELTTEEPTP